MFSATQFLLFFLLFLSIPVVSLIVSVIVSSACSTFLNSLTVFSFFFYYQFSFIFSFLPYLYQLLFRFHNLCMEHSTVCRAFHVFGPEIWHLPCTACDSLALKLSIKSVEDGPESLRSAHEVVKEILKAVLFKTK